MILTQLLTMSSKTQIPSKSFCSNIFSMLLLFLICGLKMASLVYLSHADTAKSSEFLGISFH